MYLLLIILYTIKLYDRVDIFLKKLRRNTLTFQCKAKRLLHSGHATVSKNTTDLLINLKFCKKCLTNHPRTDIQYQQNKFEASIYFAKYLLKIYIS